MCHHKKSVHEDRLLDSEDIIKFGLIKEHSKTSELMQQIVATLWVQIIRIY